MVDFNVEFKWQRGTAARWSELNPRLKAGEPGFETDTGKFKVGNGFSIWSDLPYFVNTAGMAALINEMFADIGVGEFDPRVGNLDDLSTEAKDTIVSSINEINLPTVPYTTLYNNAKAG